MRQDYPNRKMRSVCLAIAGLSLGFASSPVRADTISLQPSSQWTLDAADESCALQRNFGPPGQTIFFEMRQFSPGQNSFQFTLGSSDIEFRHVSNSRDKTITFIPDEVGQPLNHVLELDFSSGDKGVLFDIPLLPANAAADISGEEAASWQMSISAIELTEVFRGKLVLETGSMATALAAMSVCTDDLLTYWGVDAQAHRTLSRSAVPMDIEAFNKTLVENHPTRHDQRSRNLKLRLDVSAQGRVTDCHLQTAVGTEGFDQDSCETLINETQFVPALDASGNAIASYFNTSLVHVRTEFIQTTRPLF